MTDEEKGTDERGIPLQSQFPDSPPVWIFVPTFNTVLLGLGVLIAYFASYAPASKETAINTKIDLLASYDLGWLYLGIFLLQMLQLPLTVLLAHTRKESKVNVPDQHVYKVMGMMDGSKPPVGYVLMETEGVIGRFNRAQRAWMNYGEQFPMLALLYVAAGFVLPIDSFVVVMVFACARIVAAFGYVQGADGRRLGTVISVLSLSVLQGMVLIAAIKALS